MPAARQGAVAVSMVNIRGWASALFGQPTPLEAFRTLDIPVLCMVGARSLASSLGVARPLAQALPRVRTHGLADLGHMGPLTHPDVVNGEIERFFAQF
jgi:pimeloyl-ACP methyl ester carboxylesterase